MITLRVTESKQEAAELFEKSGLEQNENSLCLIARQGESIEGFCLFDIDSEKTVIRYIEPLNDLFLADGILRSALHISAERFIMKAYYDVTVPEEFFKKLGFIKSEAEKTLDIDKLFKSCQSCKGEK